MTYCDNVWVEGIYKNQSQHSFCLGDPENTNLVDPPRRGGRQVEGTLVRRTPFATKLEVNRGIAVTKVGGAVLACADSRGSSDTESHRKGEEKRADLHDA